MNPFELIGWGVVIMFCESVAWWLLCLVADVVRTIAFEIEMRKIARKYERNER